MPVIESSEVQTWNWYSMDQALAATTFSRKCGELESNLDTPSDNEAPQAPGRSEEQQSEHRSYVVASILASVAFLEASFHELCGSAPYDNLEVGGGRGGLAAEERKALKDLSEMVERNELLHKYQLVLRMLGKTPFDRGAQPFQDAQLLVQLRNALVHYKPRWREAGEGAAKTTEESHLTKALNDRRFTSNPFTSEGSPFFPDRALGHGCTVWAWKAAMAFADAFFAQLGVIPVHDGIRRRLTP